MNQHTASGPPRRVESEPDSTRPTPLHGTKALNCFLFLLLVTELAAPYNVVFGESIPDALQLVALVATPVGLLHSRRLTKTELGLGIASCILIGLSVLTIPFALAPGHHTRLMPRFFGSLALPVVLVFWVRDRSALKACLAGVVFMGVVGVGLAALQGIYRIPLYLPDQENYLELVRESPRLEAAGLNLGSAIPRVTGTIGSMGAYGSYVSIAVFTMLSGILTRSWRYQVLALLALPLGLVSVVFSQSRSGLAALIAGTVVFWALAVVRSTGHRRLIGLLLGIPPLVYSVIKLPAFIRWMSNISETTIQSRAVSNLAAIELVFQSVFAGWGFRGATAYFGIEHAVHNGFLRIGVALGLFGMLTFTGLLIYPIFVALRTSLYQDNRGLWSIGLVAGLTACIVELNFYGSFAEPAHFWCVGLLMAVARNLGPPERTWTTPDRSAGRTSDTGSQPG